MKIHRISPRGFGANTYVLTQDNQTAIVIDPSQPRVESELIKLGLTPKYVLLTHCHFDHVGGVFALQAQGAKVLCLTQEKPLFGTEADLFEAFGAPRFPLRIDETLTDGQTKTLCDIKITALHTAGHTKGSACYLIEDGTEKHLFTGDTLFAGSIGRTDFPTGDLSAMRKSLQMLLGTFTDLPVYSGHGDETTLDTERKTNPFLADI